MFALQQTPYILTIAVQYSMPTWRQYCTHILIWDLFRDDNGAPLQFLLQKTLYKLTYAMQYSINATIPASMPTWRTHILIWDPFWAHMGPSNALENAVKDLTILPGLLLFTNLKRIINYQCNRRYPRLRWWLYIEQYFYKCHYLN